MPELQHAINHLHVVVTSSYLPGWKDNREAWQVVLDALSTREVVSGADSACWCETCRPVTFADMRMVLCPICGNKRCPHATFHGNACTASNDPGQPGSSYEHCSKSYVLPTVTGQPLPDCLKDLAVRHEDGREVPVVGLYVLENETIEEALLRGLPAGCTIVRRANEGGPLTGKYGEVLAPFVAMMERELHANAGKGDRPGWLQMTPAVGMLEIYYHAAKLQKAVKDGNADGIREYAADVANMSMMLVDVCGALSAQREEAA